MPPKRSSAASKKSKSKLTLQTLDSYASSSKSVSPVPPIFISQKNNIPISKVSQPVSSLTAPPSFSVITDVKGKGKALSVSRPSSVAYGEEPLWVDKYAPFDESELAVHKLKIAAVRHWLEEAFSGGSTGSLKKYRRILALTGHAGTGKTATLNVLAKELNFEIIEWHNSLDDNFSGNEDDFDRESLTKKFQTFLTRAASCRALHMLSQAAASQPALASSSSRQIILIEDFPNILHMGTAEAFHAALEEYVSLPSDVPLVCVISDAGLRGEDPENDTMGGRIWGRNSKQTLDVRNIIPRSIFNSPYFQEVHFNPINPTLMTKALTSIVSRHFASSKSKNSKQPTKDTIQLLVESSNGDIRSTIMALQFTCVIQLPKGNKKAEARTILEAITRREQSLALFHMLGKVLYNKRKGDPHSSSISSRERDKVNEADMDIPDPPPLPDYLASHARRASRVDIETLYADSPVDTSLFALYLHQNYTQFCDDIDECDSLCDWLSWIDGSGAESRQFQQNPHQFHILALGALHSLPSPVPRRSQKMFKPQFFDILQKSRDAETAVIETEEWLSAVTNRAEGGRMWSKDEAILEIGAVLKALEVTGLGTPPSSHGKFSKLMFKHPVTVSQRMEQLDEDEEPPEEHASLEDTLVNRGNTFSKNDAIPKGWLDNDDIQEF